MYIFKATRGYIVSYAHFSFPSMFGRERKMFNYFCLFFSYYTKWTEIIMSIAFQWPLGCGFKLQHSRAQFPPESKLPFFDPAWKGDFFGVFILSGDTHTRVGETDTLKELNSASDKTSVRWWTLDGRWNRVKRRLWDLASVPLHSTPVCVCLSVCLPHVSLQQLSDVHGGIDSFCCLRGPSSKRSGYCQRNGSSVEECQRCVPW